MSLTRDFQETIGERAECDPRFHIGLFWEAVQAMSDGDPTTANVLFRDFTGAQVPALP